MMILMFIVYPVAEDVIAVYSVVADVLISIVAVSRDKILVVYNPIDTEYIRQQCVKSVIHPWLASRATPVILAVGRLTEAKNYPLLLRAFAKLRESKTCKLIVLGEGELRDSLQSLAIDFGVDKDVDFHGFVDNPYAWMHQADLFVLSSAWEGLPNVLIQAMACGVPVVSTNCRSGPAEILEGGRWGTLVPVNDYAALATAMGDVLDRDNSSLSSERADDFNIERITDCYMDVLFNQKNV